ncbi:MAG: CDP-diacylglycerol--glycerol-3-phosphate 3-phosphatidyltransferase [Pseudomonadota bacterium]
MTLNIPTILTLLRILIIPFFVLLYYLPYGWAHLSAASLFVIASVTDWLDGYMARRLNQTSRFGAFLDPVADKLIVATALVMLVERNPTSFNNIVLALPAIVIIGREITISALREWMAELGQSAKVAVSIIGKIKTIAQMIAIILLLYAVHIGGISSADVGLGFLYVAAVLTLWSMLLYIRAAWPILVKN